VRGVRLILLGVRGSTPAPGAEFVRYGGHTACVAVLPDGADVPALVLDAGTGLRSLTGMLGGAAYNGSIVVSHLHWDHVQGLPFFVAGDRHDSRVDLYVPAQGGRSGRDLLAAHMSPPSFPITPEGLQGAWTFHGLEDGDHSIEGFRVRATDIAHKGGRTFGYRVSDGHSSVAYLPDHTVDGGVEPAVHELLRGADVLLHDAQFVESERAMATAYGHSTVDDALRIAEENGVRHLVLFHHGPARTDDALDAIMAGLHTTSVKVTMAAQGATIDVPG
jgi:phosphoribosyl 1,2-cyclic phosphodiesterase